MIESRDINGQLNSGIVFKEKIHLTEIAESFLSHNMTALQRSDEQTSAIGQMLYI